MQVKQQGTSLKRRKKSSKERGKKVWEKVAVHQARMYAKKQQSTKQETMYNSIKSEGRRCAGKEKKKSSKKLRKKVGNKNSKKLDRK